MHKQSTMVQALQLGLNTGIRIYMTLILWHHFQNNLFPSVFPFVTVLLGIIQILIAGNAEYTAICQFLCQWNDIKVKEANFALVPCFSGVIQRHVRVVEANRLAGGRFMFIRSSASFITCITESRNAEIKAKNGATMKPSFLLLEKFHSQQHPRNAWLLRRGAGGGSQCSDTESIMDILVNAKEFLIRQCLIFYKTKKSSWSPWKIQAISTQLYCWISVSLGDRRKTMVYGIMVCTTYDRRCRTNRAGLHSNY